MRSSFQSFDITNKSILFIQIRQHTNIHYQHSTYVEQHFFVLFCFNTRKRDVDCFFFFF